MKRVLTVAVVIGVVGVLAGAAFAQGPGMMWGRGPGMGPGMMWGAGAGPGAGPGAGAGFCPMWGGQAAAAPEQINEEKAKALATEYAAKYFAGYTVERVLPVQGRFRTMYQVELKGPKGETRTLHVNPWGGVRPFGPFAAVN